MKRLIVMLTLLASAALAADVTGKWTGQVAGPDGNSFTINYDFKQEGAKLTGTVTGPGGDLPIQDGKVDGDKISFSVTFDGGNGAMKVGNEGAVKGDEISMTITVNGQSFGGPVTLKRAK